MIHVMRRNWLKDKFILRNVSEQNKNFLTSCLPIIEIEPIISQARPCWRGNGLIFIIWLLSRCQWTEDYLVRVKVDPDFEWGGEAAEGGMGRAWRRGRPDVAAYPWHPSDGGGGGGCSLQGSDLKIISLTSLVSLDGIEGGHPSTLRPYAGLLCGVIRWGANTIWGLDGGGGEFWAVADWAVAPGPPDADVVILVTQMGLRGSDGP